MFLEWNITKKRNIRRLGGEKMLATEKEVLFERREKLGIITFNRPQKLNSLTRNLTAELRRILQETKNDESISMLLLQGSGDRAFSAGGDLVSTQKVLLEEGIESSIKGFRGEYRSGEMIAEHPKLIISYMDGITMGGGSGLALATDFKLVTEKTRWAMPEMKIGLFPDVGVSYFFARMKNSIGMYLALTGKTIGAEDCCFAGIADIKIARESFPHFLEDMVKLSEELPKEEDLEREKAWRLGRVREISKQYALDLEKTFLEENVEKIHYFFSKDSMESIWNALKEEKSPFAQDTLEEMKMNSPLSMKVTFEQTKRAEKKSLVECYDMDSIMAGHFFRGHDIFEGIRAILIEKTKDPKWEYTSLQDIPEEVVLTYFEGVE